MKEKPDFLLEFTGAKGNPVAVESWWDEGFTRLLDSDDEVRAKFPFAIATNSDAALLEKVYSAAADVLLQRGERLGENRAIATMHKILGIDRIVAALGGRE